MHVSPSRNGASDANAGRRAKAPAPESGAALEDHAHFLEVEVALEIGASWTNRAIELSYVGRTATGGLLRLIDAQPFHLSDEAELRLVDPA
ncbi:MAG TPA: hypothetical protein VGC46_10985, partial [Allosphingosinicella sp.]